MSAFNREQALIQYSSLMSFIQTGSLSEAVANAADELERAAAKEGLDFAWHKDHYELEPITEESKAK